MSKVEFVADWGSFDTKVKNYFRDKYPDVKRAVLNVYADTAVAHAREFVRVDTGNLRSTIRKQEVEGKESEEIEIVAGGMRGRGGISQRTGKTVGGRDVDYAYWVHEGTSKMSPNPFLIYGAYKANQVLKKSDFAKIFD